MLKVPKIRSEKHRRFIASMPCCICRKPDTQAAHIRHGNGAGMGLKSGDDCTVPLCITCHKNQHENNECVWWSLYGGIEKATALAKDLYKVTGDSIEALKLIAGFR